MVLHFYNIHGLIRGENLEIGLDADNGGQLVYLMGLARALSRDPRIEKLHIFTRKIEDPALDPVYAQTIERLGDKAEIRRISCGGKRYLPKEKLWPHLDEFVANALAHIKKHSIVPDWIHSHYADAGYVADQIGQLLHVPFSHVAHSLGRLKKEKLMLAGSTEEELEKRYCFRQRIEAEERTLAHSEFVVTSTTQEIELCERYTNIASAVFHVIPPGIDLDVFYPYFEDSLDTPRSGHAEKQALFELQKTLEIFLTHPEKPLIVTICRPDRNKNIAGLIHAFGTDRELQAMANLAIFAGVRTDITTMPDGEKETLTEILLLMDKYNLYGRLAIPKKHSTRYQVPALYRLAATRHGVFVNAALAENFGITTLEAAGSGLPVVVTRNGGPVEIVRTLENGITVDPSDAQAIQKAIKTLLTDRERWETCSRNGLERVRQSYSWESHADHFLELVQQNRGASAGQGLRAQNLPSMVSERFRTAVSMLVSDVDGTLILPERGNPGLEVLRRRLRARPGTMLFGIATGRHIGLALEAVDRWDIPVPDFFVTSVGTVILYGSRGQVEDKGWQTMLTYRWSREVVANLLRGIPWLVPQSEESQGPFKVSYTVRQESWDPEAMRRVLGKHYYRVNLVYSHGHFLDVVPRRAGKGRAIRYLSNKWGIPSRNIVLCGDSGNDLDMMVGPMHGVIVGNRSEELSGLRGRSRVYVARGPAAEGVLEGMDHFEEELRPPHAAQT